MNSESTDPDTSASPAPPTPGQAAPEGEPRRGRGRPRDPQTDVQIIDAAADLLRRRGFEKMTVDDVAALAGVGKATVYRRWPSKDDLAVAAMSRLYGVEFPLPDTGSIVDDLAQSYRAVLEFVGTPEGLAYVKTSIAESVRDERIAALYRTATMHAEDRAREMWERAIKRGEVREDIDIECCVQWLGGILATRAITNRPFPSVDEVDRLVSLTLRGVLVT